MTLPGIGAALRAWRRGRRRWPLRRQMAVVFAAVMLGNAALVVIATNIWGVFAEDRWLSQLTPQARRAYDEIQADRLPDRSALVALQAESKRLMADLAIEGNVVLYGAIRIAAVLSFTIGYLLLGRLGRGLTGVAGTARRIAGGDMGARAEGGGFSSLEETQLTIDFNSMAASLQRAERELAESTASIAHELRTPLTILRGRLHGMADGLFALEPQEVTGLLYQVEGLARLVDDLQTVSLANSGRLIMSFGQTDLAIEVSRVLDAMGPDLAKAGLDPVVCAERAPLMADGVRLRQVIAAVLANVCRYAPDSGVVRISTRQSRAGVFLEILDHGPGLPADSEERAFDRFWRGEASRSRNTGGTGLGLAVVRTIAEAHGGSVTIGNHDGGGTLFTLRLPVLPRLHTSSTPA